jgi:hypothetical protein
VNVVTEASVVINSLLDGIKDLPLTSLTGIDAGQMRQIESTLSGVATKSQALSAALGDSLPEEGPGLDDRTSEVQEGLNRVLQLLSEFQSEVKRVQTRLAELKPETLAWIKAAPFIITVVLAWVALSQMSLFAHAWSWLRR